MSFSAGVDLDWCLTCNRHLDSPNTNYCSPQCEPTPSQQILHLSSDANDWTQSEELDASGDDAVIFHIVHDTSSAKGIAAWAANIPTGAPPSGPSTLPSYSVSPPKLLRPQYARPVPPTLSMSQTTSASIPLATPPQKDVSMLSSLANHIRSFVSSSSTGFPVNKLRARTKKRFPYTTAPVQHRISSLSSDSFAEDDYEFGPSFSTVNSPHEDTKDPWWTTESDCSSAASSMVLKKSAAQLIATSESRKYQLECEMCFQPKVLPIRVEPSSKDGLSDYGEFDLRGRQIWS
ncbi:hypothetical protein C8J55DRAFT_554021 [Lentinula edodes]|uniref:Uncharacterized protein n=1 Tax=Lentinula lateritia TaxID=40482 RepID=A0A9W9B5K1_9AGAR|nr:hypothetical protein C8J55DRAFT_554021 [Lentinula edodes]